MLTDDQIKGFETFGLLLIRAAFSPQEMQTISQAGEQMWADREATDPQYHTAKDVIVAFVERHDQLRPLMEDDRIFLPMQQLLGSGFIWAGSEGHREINPTNTAHPWHADRGGTSELGYTRIKIMLYLQPMEKDRGALRVIPGSHRSPLHESLEPFESAHYRNPNPTYFGMAGTEVPCYPVETVPGDMLMFNQALYHAVYGKPERRRYVALKYAAKPTTEQHIESLKQRSANVFSPDESLLQNPNPRIQQMLAGIPQVTL